MTAATSYYCHADDIFSANQQNSECNTQMSAVFGLIALCYVRTCQCTNSVLDINCFNCVIVIIGTWVILTNQNQHQTSEPILYRDYLIPMILMPFIKLKYSGCMFNTAMLKYYYEIWVSHFPLKIWRLASTIQANTPKEQLSFFISWSYCGASDFTCYVVQRLYINFLSSNSEFDLNG